MRKPGRESCNTGVQAHTEGESKSQSENSGLIVGMVREGTCVTIPGSSSKLVRFFGFLFFGMATFDVVMHRLDLMTSTYLFLGLLAFAVAFCLQNIERRITSLERSLQVSKKG